MIVIEHKNEELPHHRNLRITIGKIFYETAVLAQTIVMDFCSENEANSRWSPLLFSNTPGTRVVPGCRD